MCYLDRVHRDGNAQHCSFVHEQRFREESFRESYYVHRFAWLLRHPTGIVIVRLWGRGLVNACFLLSLTSESLGAFLPAFYSCRPNRARRHY